MQEMYHRLVKGEKDKDIMRTLLLSERNYYKYKKKLSKKLEERQKERMESTIWLEVQTLKDRMSQLYSVLAERVKDPYTKTNDLPNLVSTAESIAINILKLESASITAIKLSNNLEKHVIRQLPSRTKQQELPQIIYSKKICEADSLMNENNIIESNNRTISYND
jgi:ACT domain-containing protein